MCPRALRRDSLRGCLALLTSPVPVTPNPYEAPRELSELPIASDPSALDDEADWRRVIVLAPLIVIGLGMVITMLLLITLA